MTEGLDLHLGVDKGPSSSGGAGAGADRAGAAGRRPLHGLHADGYWRESGGDRPAALIIGYATPPPHAWSRALEALAEVVQEN